MPSWKRLLPLTVLLPLLVALAEPASAQQRELILTRWETDRWALPSGAAFERNQGTTPDGEPITRIHLPLADTGMATQVNLPATAQTITAFLRKTSLGPGRHQAVFQDVSGWGGIGETLWGLKEDARYTSPVHQPGTKGWTWRVGFFKTEARAPIRFRGFRLEAPKNATGSEMVLDAGPVRVSYTPDDTNWLYADLQPKTITARDGDLPSLTLRLANLGTRPRTFRLTVTPEERNLRAYDGRPVTLTAITLAPGEQKQASLELPLPLLGRYTLRYRVDGERGAIAEETVNVVNRYDVAEGFRRWTARRQWFTAPNRKPGTGADGKATISVTSVDNGISSVPLFPTLPRKALESATPASAEVLLGGKALSVLATQLSPAWLLRSAERRLTLFAGATRAGLGGPTRIAFATRNGTRVLRPGQSVDAAGLAGMARPWLVVWWQDSPGWSQWDAPMYVQLQRRPTSLALTADGVAVSFASAAGYVAVMPLYGYAKLPQQSAWRANADAFRLPPSWSGTAQHPWTWDDDLPDSVVERCNWWASALLRFPYDVRETYTVDHASGSVRVRDTFDYIEIDDDWNTAPRTLAPLSPTLAAALRGGFPLTVEGKLEDWEYPTLLGPYSGVAGAKEIGYHYDIGDFWQVTADPDLTVPPDASTASREAQLHLLATAEANSLDFEAQMWQWNDENFVWYAQTNDNRFPAYWTAWQRGELRHDRKGWMQSRTLFTLLDRARYKMDERGGTLTRRYIDGPGIGNWGSHYWGDSGKLGTDMIWNAWLYAYCTGDYQTIADNWDLIASLNTLPTTMIWAGVGRMSIAEMGDEAPPMLGLARLAYAVGDRDTYAAAVYWYARELVHHHVKEGAHTRWREQFSPWHATLELPTETPTNMWGSNAAWQGGGFRTTQSGENQWTNFYVRFDDIDTIRFHRKYALEMPRRVLAAATEKDSRDNYGLYFIRTALLDRDPAQARADYGPGKENRGPDTYITRRMIAAREFAPRMETLIPDSAAPISDTGWAWAQMNHDSVGLLLPPQGGKNGWPALQWFWWNAPRKIEGVENGDKWTFGDVRAGGAPSGAPTAVTTKINEVTHVSTYGTP